MMNDQESTTMALPADVIGHILDFFNGETALVSEKLRIAAVSRDWRSAVFKNASWWQNISFGNEHCCINKITNKILNHLLVRVNALHVTQHISLVGLPSVTFRPLRQLQRSTVLQELDLRFDTTGEIGPMGRHGAIVFVQQHLENPHSRLQRVRFRRQEVDHYDACFSDQEWRLCLRQLLERAISIMISEKRAFSCGCQASASNCYIDQESSNTTIVELNCHNCRNPTCCIEHYETDHYSKVEYCLLCDRSFCNGCMFFPWVDWCVCNASNGLICAECADYRVCDNCDDMVCGKCGEGTYFCEVCSKDWCEDCTTTKVVTCRDCGYEATVCDNCESCVLLCSDCGSSDVVDLEKQIVLENILRYIIDNVEGGK